MFAGLLYFAFRASRPTHPRGEAGAWAGEHGANCIGSRQGGRHAPDRRPGCIGSRTVKALPSPGALATAIDFVIARPRPEPPYLRAREASLR
ncbi:hypothetical protein SAMN02799624_04449 [Paenibacillus sp. UNC496MF]|nr:hypothetical protein SAMN02799624_04449 [Paenibacillus sp. UNC496MF]